MQSSKHDLEWLEPASITLPLGFTAGAVAAGVKTYGTGARLDLGALASDRPCVAAGIFTKNKVQGAPVVVSRERVASGAAQVLVVNSGCSNVAMGERGLNDARAMADRVAKKLGIAPELALVGSTGVIGRPLPMDKIASGIDRLELSREGGPDFSQAIMTTDTFPKCRAVRFRFEGKTYHVAGTAKGSGMSHPDMATVFCFLTSDAAVGASWLRAAIKRVGDQSINMVDVDTDTSTSDMMIALCNGAAGGPMLDASESGSALFEAALLEVSIALAKDLARDGEGASKMIEVRLRGAASLPDARHAARTVIASPLVKAMVKGCDPNLGRVLMAIGKSQVQFDLERVSVWIGEHQAFQCGVPTELDYATIGAAMKSDTVVLEVDLGAGPHAATAWGCDLTEEYVRINADYTT